MNTAKARRVIRVKRTDIALQESVGRGGFAEKVAIYSNEVCLLQELLISSCLLQS